MELRRKDKRQKKYPKLPVVSARDGTEADAVEATPLASGEVFERADCDLGPSQEMTEVRLIP